MNIKRLAIDLAKDVFQLYGVDEQRKAVIEKQSLRYAAREIRNKQC